MREYELTYLISDEVAEAEVEKVIKKVAGFVDSEEGKVSKEESWGRRKLCYPIQKQNFATYVTIWFELDASKIPALDHELRVYPPIIRHLVTLKVQKAEELAVTKEDIIDTKDVEQVLGEKSFEVVEGETEGSKDLMAVRDATGEDKEVEKDKDDEKIEAKPKPEKETEKPEAEQEKVPEEPVVEEKVVKAKKIEKPVESKEDESDRMKKLDEKLDELLGDDL